MRVIYILAGAVTPVHAPLAAGLLGLQVAVAFTIPVHANSANMLSLRRGFCTFNSASLLK